MTQLTFDDAGAVAPTAEPTQAAETAVECQRLIEDYKLKIEELTARRDEAVAIALEGGVKVYGGYTLVARAPAATVSDVRLAETHPDLMDDYIAWYQKTHPAKLSKTDLAKYLRTIQHPSPDAVLADATVPGKGAPTYSMVKNKEAEE